MESELRAPNKGKKKLYRAGRQKSFFDRKSKILKMSYGEISIFLTLLFFIIVGLFINVITEFVQSFF